MSYSPGIPDAGSKGTNGRYDKQSVPIEFCRPEWVYEKIEAAGIRLQS